MLYATSFRIRHFMLTVVLFFAGAVVANASVSASFRGPDSVHLAYGFDAGGKDWRIIVNSSDVLVLPLTLNGFVLSDYLDSVF